MCFGSPKRQFPATNHISGHFRPNGKSYFEKSRIPKFAKKSILTKNSNFDRVADIGRDDEIWPEMSPWGVLESFCTRNQYLNPFRSLFMQFWKIAFFASWFVGFGHFGAGRIFYGSKIWKISAGIDLSTICPFPKKMPPIKSEYLQNAIGICILTLFCKNDYLYWLSDLLD